MRLRSIISAGVLLALPALAFAAEPGRLQLPDFSTLSKIATQQVNISLDPSLLRLASGVIDSNDSGHASAVNSLIQGIRGIYVRSYTFDKPGRYSMAQVKALQAQLLAPGWQAVVSTQDVKQGSNVDIYILRSGNRTDGVAIIAAEPRQLTVVNIVGSIDLAKLAQLQGQFGVPKMGLTTGGAPQSSAATAQTH
ncbi:MAG TPA: DUF4252 domain-containing protein [Steroidobacteraceae bacterium]|jgi:hypothetical protein|nr:DUF4252 domain-containing protein [Steroidobacteraceae bacterium]